MSSGGSRRRWGEVSFVSAFVLVVYFVAALGLNNLYPFSTFPMYSRSAFTSGARLIVLSADGEPLEITRYEQWSCPELKPVTTVMCPDGQTAQPAEYLAKEATDYIEAHSGDGVAGAEPVEIVVHAWRLHPDAPTTEVDCPVTSCTAVRR